MNLGEANPDDLGEQVGHSDLKVGEEYYYAKRSAMPYEMRYRKVKILEIRKVNEGHFTPKLLFLDKNEVVNHYGIGPEADPDYEGDGNTYHQFYKTKQKEYYQEGLGNLVNAGKTTKNTAGVIGKFLGLGGGLRLRGSLRRRRHNKTRRGGRKSKRRLSRRR